MKKTIKELEEELKSKTGETELHKPGLSEKNKFNPLIFMKLAKEVKKIFEDERNTNTNLKPA